MDWYLEVLLQTWSGSLDHTDPASSELSVSSLYCCEPVGTCPDWAGLGLMLIRKSAAAKFSPVKTFLLSGQILVFAKPLSADELTTHTWKALLTSLGSSRCATTRLILSSSHCSPHCHRLWIMSTYLLRHRVAADEWYEKAGQSFWRHGSENNRRLWRFWGCTVGPYKINKTGWVKDASETYSNLFGCGQSYGLGCMHRMHFSFLPTSLVVSFRMANCFALCAEGMRRMIWKLKI